MTMSDIPPNGQVKVRKGSGAITIPEEIRQVAGIEEGDHMRVWYEDGLVKAEMLEYEPVEDQ